MSILLPISPPERCSCAELLRELLGLDCAKDEFDAAVSKLETGGSEAADAWLWFLMRMPKMPGEKRAAEGRLAELHRMSGERFISSHPDLVVRCNSTPAMMFCCGHFPK